MGERQSRTNANTTVTGLSRRQFVTRLAGAGAAAMIVPRRVLGRGFQAPSDTLNIAVVGSTAWAPRTLRR